MAIGDGSPIGLDGRLLGKLCAVAVVFATLYLTAGLGDASPNPGRYGHETAIFVFIAGIARTGTVGGLVDRLPVVVFVAELVLLGFWQAVLRIVMLPAALGLVVAGVILAHVPR